VTLVDEIALRMRKNRGRRLWPEFRRALAVAIDEEINDSQLLSIADTESLRELYFDRLKHGADVLHLERDAKGLESLLRVLRDMATRLSQFEILLLHQHDRLTGALRVRTGAVLLNAVRVWAVVGQDLFLTTPAAADGLCLEFSHLSEGDRYELHLWGRFRQEPPQGMGI
jgi:hypothetical protein